MGQIILASASPRRKELLEQIGLEFEICPAKGEEVISKSAPEEVVMELSEQKATEVAAMVKTYESGHGETPSLHVMIPSLESRKMKPMQSGCSHFCREENMPCIQALRLCFWIKTDERAHIPFTRKQKLP